MYVVSCFAHIARFCVAWAHHLDAVEKESAAGFCFLDSLLQAGVSFTSVPTTDHYIPMLYTLGLADGKEEIRQVYESVEYGGLSMRTFQVG